MPDKVTYYAVVDDLSSREQPAGVFRRIYTEVAAGLTKHSLEISSGNSAQR